jgi:superfamily II DNA or RNA helicase
MTVVLTGEPVGAAVRDGTEAAAGSEAAPASPPPPERRTGRAYWQAQGIAEIATARFDAGARTGDVAAQRQAAYVLAAYHRRTRRILRSALEERREPLAQTALRNLVVLQRPLARMHESNPAAIPLVSVLDRPARDDVARDLLVRALAESPEPQPEDKLVARVNEARAAGHVPAAVVRRQLVDLEATGHAERADRGWARTNRPYTESETDERTLGLLVGPSVHAALAGAGFRGLTDLVARPEALRERAPDVLGLGPETADLLVEAAAVLLETRSPRASAWRHADLIGSPYPRPYQYEAFSVFRRSAYRSTLVESPTGSGKTLIGMLCIQDWLRVLRPGQSILVLVPTANYQQQWVGELCYKPIGLRLPPELVFSGTPSELERFQRRTGGHPAIILTTYAALAQTGSGVGKGGFDVDSIEMFLQAANVQFAILDEVHKVVEDMRSVSADVTRQLVAWQRDGSIAGLIGFSGTAEAYRPRFTELGLTLAHTIPLDALIGCGFVAPFVELGAPFANSVRERRIRDLLDAYKADLLAFLALVGPQRLRAWFAEVPLDERVAIGRRLLRMYPGRPDGDEATARRLTGWEQGGDITISEAPLVTILQTATGWTDDELAKRAEADETAAADIRERLLRVRQELAGLIYLPSTVALLERPGFGTELDAASLRALPDTAMSAAARAERTAELLATTAVGLYDGLSGWYLRTGEGRVETIKALIDAERAARPVSGIIVFDTGKRIRWRRGLTAPGYDGVGGLFAQLLGDERFTAFAALSSEMYFTLDEADPLPPRIAAFIEKTLMRGEIAGAIFALATQGLDVDDAVLGALRAEWQRLVDEYVSALGSVRARRLGEFRRRILAPFRRAAAKPLDAAANERLKGRLSTRNVHLAGLITTFYDYALLADAFRRAPIGEIEQVSGARQRFFVVPMPGGRRKQLMYDLTARIVDAEELPVNLVMVSTWARTGWNVLRPNVLIDATATRDVTAWQQLRGRAMRAPATWTNDCYRLLAGLRGDGLGDGVPPELSALLEAARSAAPETEDAGAGRDGALAVGLVLGRNKVTHIYELVKAIGGARQVEYDRTARTWGRRESIARKHAHEASVDPLHGGLATGVAHAPLLYAADPRTDLPTDLEARVGDVIDGLDPRAVRDWLAAADR